ncbi:ubiquitin-conjugating enzyme E2 J1-like [Cylas formicarius]|uniref:ubiquitin-conjugating enzyme E2 J1-like n=1 Tax=Cylas formicarius TaxID=197179 RepID=UPI0029588949|nr:ubiquitin-conjugating enzyme E2 J1-like [Cylas formicarius]
MSLETKYNLKSPGVKRLMREAKELANATEEYYACPLDDNLFEWHFTVRGPSGTEFESGFYHGRILLPSQYPMQPPNIILLTPNGRFEINKKICLSISGHHPESWQPSWSIRTALLALIAFMPTQAQGTIGSLEYTAEERQVLAKKSRNWECSICGKISDQLGNGENNASPMLTQEESSMIQNIALKAEEEVNRKEVIESKTMAHDSSNGLNQHEHEIRQRINSDQARFAENNTESNNEQSMTDQLLQESIKKSRRDKFWKTVTWIIILTIVVLVIRRVFFL